jgi:nitrogen-specific signal transduction histidine kinase
VQHELVQVNDVVRSVLPLARAAAERRGARTEATLEPGLPRVLSDRTRLAQALTLFVTDAAEATGPESPLMITTARDGSHALIRISPPHQHETDGTTALILASRLIGAQGGSATVGASEILLRLGV